MKKRLVIAVYCLLIGVIPVYTLYLLSEKMHLRKNGFNRLFVPQPLTIQSVFDLTYNSYYIGGCRADQIYLGNSTSPNKILRLNFLLRDTQTITPHFPGREKIAWRMLRFTVDSSKIYAFEPITPGYFAGDTDSFKLINKGWFNQNFNELNPLSPGSCIFSFIDTIQMRNELAKSACGQQSIFSVYSFSKAPDLFQTDGMLRYSEGSSRLLYIYYYRNGFLVMDTNLHVLYQASTIDTLRNTTIKIAHVNHKFTLGEPPPFISKHAFANQKWLFIHSALKADNEDMHSFKGRSVIDVYALSDGRYHFSFYIPSFVDHQMNDFALYNNWLICLYDHFIISYRINFSLSGVDR